MICNSFHVVAINLNIAPWEPSIDIFSFDDKKNFPDKIHIALHLITSFELYTILLLIAMKGVAYLKLIIAEKPSVAKSIASALGASSRADGFYEGNGLLVSWCVGHLVSPMDAGGYDENFKKWRYDDLPILPEPFRYVLAPGKEDAFENLRALMNRSDVDTIVNACDAGREGELIFRLVYEMTGCRKPVLRLWISSMEDSAIREGFSDLRPGAD